MSKKSKKKKNKKSYYSEYQFGGKGKSKKSSGKKKGGNKKSYYAEPKLKSVKPTLSKKDAKKNRKMLLAPVEIPEAFIKSRKSCNHVGDVLTVAQFKEMTPTYAAFTPMLDTMVNVFGEDNVAVCAQCYDVLVNAAAINEDDFDRAVAVLYAAANMAVSYNRMKGDEIKEIAKIRMNLTGWGKIKERFMAAKETITVADTEGGSGKLSEEDLAKLNRNGGAYVT